MVNALIEAEIARRKDITAKTVACISLRTYVDRRLDELERDTRAAKVAAGKSVNGVTGNEGNWLEVAFRRFANTVFSNKSAKELPPLRPGYGCAIDIKEGEKLSTAKLYDMNKV